MRSSTLRLFSLFVAIFSALHALPGPAHVQAQAAPPPPPPVYAQPYPQQPVYAPAPAPVVQPVYVTRPLPARPRRGLLVAGTSTLAASYAVGLITGAILVDTKCCQDAGWSLFIPVAGPFMAAHEVDHARGALVLLGAVQVIGLGLTVGGVVQYIRSQNRIAQGSYAQAPRDPGLALTLREGRSLALDVSTTPYLTGPSARLRF